MPFPASLRGLEGDNRARITVWVMEDAEERSKQMFIPISISYRYTPLRSRLVTGGPPKPGSGLSEAVGDGCPSACPELAEGFTPRFWA